ncbi:MAG: AMP-binding protein, partial [Bacteroidota bacterium]
MIDSIQATLRLDYWANKLRDKEVRLSTDVSPKLIGSQRISAGQLSYFYKLTAGNYLAEQLVLTALAGVLLERYRCGYEQLMLVSGQDGKESSSPSLITTQSIGQSTLKDQLQYLKKEFQSALQNKDVDRQQLRQRLNGHDLSSYTFFAMHYGPTEKKMDAALPWQLLIEKEADNGLQVQLKTSAVLFDESLLQHWLQQFTRWLTQLDDLMDQPLHQIDLLSASEKKRLLKEFNDTDRPFPQDKTFVDLFEEQVRLHPEEIIAEYEGRSWSHRQLNEEANRLAHGLLRECQIQPDDLVGIKIPKSDDCLLAILAVLKSGAAFLPIDPNYPEDRIQYILQDSGMKCLIESTSGQSDSDIPSYQLQQLRTEERSNPGVALAADNLAYVIYTSGSTGRPKGVMIEHRSNVNMSLDQIRRFDVTKEDRIAWFASIAFDATVYELMMALYSSATLVIPTDELVKDTAA